MIHINWNWIIPSRPVIIGIHGLKNKPPRRQLRRWWKKSIREGLSRISKKRRFFRFVFVYWAHFIYPRPLNKRIKDKTHPLYMNEPYQPARKEIRRKKGFLQKSGLRLANSFTNLLFQKGEGKSPANKLWELMLRRFFNDLDVYYHKSLKVKRHRTAPAKIVIREQLRKTLIKYRKRKIMLIAHSMGSIIAYDVLSALPPDYKVHTFVTIGSPLGFPGIKRQLLLEQKEEHKTAHDLKIPDAVQKGWFNFADLKDKVALDYRLRDDFKPNTLGICIQDISVTNDYQMKGQSNPHNAYGYLRTPELAKLIDAFLSGKT
jgi:hypothetical protein